MMHLHYLGIWNFTSLTEFSISKCHGKSNFIQHTYIEIVYFLLLDSSCSLYYCVYVMSWNIWRPVFSWYQLSLEQNNFHAWRKL